MKEIHLTIMDHGPKTLEQLKTLLESFEARHRIRVNVETIDWGDAWSRLIRIALYKEGAHISEIGSTWVSDFARMVALRSFAPEEVLRLGIMDHFLPSSWKSCVIVGQPDIWAVPWLADTRYIAFRRDHLAKAGVDDEVAFHSPEQMEITLAKLQEAGIETPWVIPTHLSRMTIHNVAAWVWGAGGHFLSEDGKRTCFSESEAIDGFTKYFQLARYLEPNARNHTETESDALYWSGQASVTLSGPWLLQDERVSPEVLNNSGFVSPPGVPFVGGSHLVVWRHTHLVQEALELLRFLTSPEVQIAYSQSIGLLPTQLGALAEPFYSDNPFYERLVNRLKTGRSFRSVPLWGLVEERLSTMFSGLWADVLAEPELPEDLRSIIEERMEALSGRLDLTLTAG